MQLDMLLSQLREAQHKKWSFPLRISSVNVTKLMYNFIFCAVGKGMNLEGMLGNWWKIGLGESGMCVSCYRFLHKTLVALTNWLKLPTNNIFFEYIISKFLCESSLCVSDRNDAENYQRRIRWSVSLCIQSEYAKIRTSKNSVLGHFSRSSNENNNIPISGEEMQTFQYGSRNKNTIHFKTLEPNIFFSNFALLSCFWIF